MPYLWHIDPADVRESIKVGTVVYVRVETNLVVHMSNAHSISALKVIDDKLPVTWTDIKSIEAILWLNKALESRIITLLRGIRHTSPLAQRIP